MHLLQSTFLCLGNTPWAPLWTWPFASSNTFSFFRFLAPETCITRFSMSIEFSITQLSVFARCSIARAFRVSRIFDNQTFRVGRILCNLDFHVSNTTGTSYFLLRAANPANSVNPASLICPSIRAAAWANPGNSANLICLLVHVAVLANPARVMLLYLANPVKPAVVTRIFFLECDLCSNTCHPQVAQPHHLTTLGQYYAYSFWVLLVLEFQSRRFALTFMNWLTNASSIDMNLVRHLARP
jgi:hypothetical protein